METISNVNGNTDNKSVSEMVLSEEAKQPRMFHELAIEGRGLTFYYDRKKQRRTLKNVDININKGAIYGLLGPSGCGKTTLLKCIISRLKPSNGYIQIYGKCPGDPSLHIPGRGIGYMPQELALYADITVKETLVYFGSLYSMGKKRLKKRISFLLDFLEIPQKDSFIRNLSGGQKRRVSFACALIHEPPLLVLDEPTVGVDPLLRSSIWDHLNELTAQNHMTIIITTHYVEEARKADRVGLMRNGSILAESHPETLIQQHGVQTLEDVFKKLCRKDNDNTIKEERNGYAVPFKLSSHLIEGSNEYEELRLMQYGVTLSGNNGKKVSCDPPSVHVCNGGKNTMFYHDQTPSNGFRDHFKKTNALITKSFTCLRRNTLFLLFQIFVPALQVLLFCVCVGQEPFDLKVAIVNNETNIFGYSEMFLNTLNNRTFKQVTYDSLPDALSAVRKGEAWGAMYVGPRFSAALTDRILEGSNVENQTIHDSTIRLYLDLTNQQIAFTIYARLVEAFQNFAKQMLEKLYQNPFLSEPPIKIEEPVYGTITPSFSEFIAPGVILGLTHLFAIGLTLLSIVMEKKEGLLDRCWVAGVSAGEMISAIMAVLFVTMIAQLILVILFTLFIVNVNVVGSIFWLFVCLLLSGISGMAYGLLISTLCDTEVEAVFIALGTFYPIFLFSGMMWPVEGMPYYLRYISYCLPLTFLTDAIRSVILRGWDITDHYTWVGCAVPLVWTVFFILVSCILLRRRLSQ